MAHSTAAEQPEEDARLDIDFLLGKKEEEKDEREVFKIGDLSREFGVTLRTLRFYEDRGLLSPQRRGTTRLYSRRDRARLRLILLGKSLGFSLTEAKQIIEIYAQPDGRRKQYEVALERFVEQQKVLQDQKAEIEAAIRDMTISIDFVREQLKKIAD
ncbi:MerR family DNA-binding transcriptional regulator [Aurantimonas sp. Leaf443]|uniref:MerR family transcriptional regulator n=1 Tax=Aurantimonas sp. Leaf443 TaxID=1736378 RepID=UPI0009E68447|nr:MerR family DNA-binding transcriptional regulator [Aurantimonas sp. Leaf443]